jgi:F0F1-type ATP synthase membrane subunit b/b'
VLRELVTRPVNAAIALIELPATVQRSLRQANELMETSQRQLEAMQDQTEEALRQAERMNDLLGRVVKLTEPLEFAARGGEYVGGRLKRALLGEDGTIDDRGPRLERAVEDAEKAAGDAEAAATEADAAAEEADEVEEGR